MYVPLNSIPVFWIRPPICWHNTNHLAFTAVFISDNKNTKWENVVLVISSSQKITTHKQEEGKWFK
jgi:hypothetical protein